MERPIKNIVVLRGGALGDCLVTLPSLRLLREQYPDARITLVGNPYSGPLFEGSTSIDRLLMLFHKRNNIRYMLELYRLRRGKPDLLLDFQDGGRSRFQAAAIGGKRRIGFNTRPQVARFLFTDPVERDKSVHVTRRISNVLAPLGILPSESILDAELELRESDHEAATAILRSHRVCEQFAFLQVTSGRRPEHRMWPAERFARVAEHLYRRGMRVVVTGAADDEAIRAVIEEAACPVEHISDKMPTLTLAALIAQSQLYVGYNTGPMHLAGALGRKIVALFDVPTDLVEWYPATSASCRIVQAKPYPLPPGWRLDTVEVDEVVEAIDSLGEELVLEAVM